MMFAFIFQGLHYLCLKCQRVQRFFKAKADVKRHLQEQHSGIQFQCSICGYLFHRRNISHACNATEFDMEYVDPITGIYGEQARQKLKKFINEEQDNYWRYVATVDELDLPESPFPGVRSVVVRVDPPREPRPRKRRDKTPESLGSTESIVLEEPPKKKQQLEELLQDLACTPSISLSSISLSEEDSETDVEIEPSKNPDKHNKKDAKKVDDDKPKQRKNVTDQTKKIEKSIENNKKGDTVQKTAKQRTEMEKIMGRDKKQESKEKEAKVVKENAKRREKEGEEVEKKDKDKRKDNVKQKRYSLSEEGEKRNERDREGNGSLSCKTMKEKDKQTETVKNKTNHTESKSEKRKETETEMSKGIEKMKSNDKRIESKVGQECTKETDSEQITITEITNKVVEQNEESEDGVTEKIIGKGSESSNKHINLMERGDVEEENEINSRKKIKDKKDSDKNNEQKSEKEHENKIDMRTDSVIIEEGVNEKDNEMEKELEIIKEGVNEIETQEVEDVENINNAEETGNTEIDNAEQKGENEYRKNKDVNEIDTEEIMDTNKTDKQGERNDNNKHTDTQNINMDKTKVKEHYREQVKANIDIQSERTKGSKELKQIEEREKQKLKCNENETKRLKDRQNEQKGLKDISKSKLSKVRDQSKMSKLKVKEMKEMNNKQVVVDTKVKQTQSKQTQKKGGENKVNKVKKVLSDKNSNRNDAKSVNEMQPGTGKENKVIKSDAKKKVTIKEYQARKLEQNANEQILENIMAEMTNTYDNMKVLSPIQDAQTFSETINAVASITRDSVEETYEKAADVISACALDFIDELITQEVVDSAVEQEVNTYLNEKAEKDTEMRMNENETTQKRMADKRKCSETEGNVEGIKKEIL